MCACSYRRERVYTGTYLLLVHIYLPTCVLKRTLLLGFLQDAPRTPSDWERLLAAEREAAFA
jgi:hypothetical protein